MIIMTVKEFIKQTKYECSGYYKRMLMGFWCVKIEGEECIADPNEPNGHWEEVWV